MTVWLHVSCGCCAGIKWGGEYPVECDSCWGWGSLWVSDKDRMALYPGGPFLGHDPGCFTREALHIGVEVAA